MKNAFDITSFGAVGDGVTDCTECIVKENAYHQGVLREFMLLAGDNSTCAISDNVGSAVPKG